MAILYQCHHGSVDRAMDCCPGNPGSIPHKSKKFSNYLNEELNQKVNKNNNNNNKNNNSSNSLVFGRWPQTKMRYTFSTPKARKCLSFWILQARDLCILLTLQIIIEILIQFEKSMSIRWKLIMVQKFAKLEELEAKQS